MTIRDDSDDALIDDDQQCCKDSSTLNEAINSIIVPVPKSVSNDAERGECSEKKECEVGNWNSRLALLKTFTLEPLMIMYMISYIVGRVCNQNLLIDKSCLYVFFHPANVCNHLDNYTQEKKEIETYSFNYNIYISLINNVPAVLFSMVIGPWSDKYGRKLPIIIAIIGGILQNIGTMLNVIYFDAPMYYLLIGAIPGAFTGGMICFILCIYSLASEQTSQRHRTIKYAFIELAVGIGMPLGTFLGGFLYKKYGYLSVYILAMSFQAVALPWVIFVIKETRTTDKRMTWNIIKDLFCFDNFKESFRTITKPRDDGRRKEIWLLVGSMCVLIMTLLASADFGYYFTRYMFNFDVTFYSNLNTIFISCGMLFSVFVVILLSRVLKLKNVEGIYGCIGSVSAFSSSIIKGLSTKTWIYYLACTCGLLVGIAPLAVRSRISKIVKEDELGKVFAFLSSCETLTPVISSVVYNQIFNASIDFFPGLAYIVCGALVILPLATFPWIIRRKINPNESEPLLSDHKEALISEKGE